MYTVSRSKKGPDNVKFCQRPEFVSASVYLNEKFHKITEIENSLAGVGEIGYVQFFGPIIIFTVLIEHY